MSELSNKFGKVKAFENAHRTQTTKDFPKQKLWFEWGDKNEHTVRFVGEFVWAQQHWIAKTQFGVDYEIFPESAFTGDEALRKSILCGNWDVDGCNEVEAGCPICELGKKANAIIGSPDCDEELKKSYIALRNKCRPQQKFFIKVIDRENPYVSEGEKGYKILQMPNELLSAISQLDESIGEFSISSEDKGCDVVIKREPPINGKGRTKYSVTPVFDGITMKQTPLTNEEKAFRPLDLKKFIGLKYDRSALLNRMCKDATDILSAENDGDDIPF